MLLVVSDVVEEIVRIKIVCLECMFRTSTNYIKEMERIEMMLAEVSVKEPICIS